MLIPLFRNYRRTPSNGMPSWNAPNMKAMLGATLAFN